MDNPSLIRAVFPCTQNAAKQAAAAATQTIAAAQNAAASNKNTAAHQQLVQSCKVRQPRVWEWPAEFCCSPLRVCVCVRAGRGGSHPSAGAGSARQSGETRGPQCSAGAHHCQPELPAGAPHTHKHTEKVQRGLTDLGRI